MKQTVPENVNGSGKKAGLFFCLGGIMMLALVVAIYQLKPRPEKTVVEPVERKSLKPTRIEPRTSPPDRPEDTMRSSIAESLGYSGDLTMEARVRELMDMRGPLTAPEIEECFRALLAKPRKGESIARHSTWFHELANLLQRQKPDQQAFAEVMATVARDDGRDLASRDYSLQHLNRIWRKAAKQAELRQSIETTLGVLARTDNPLRSTALLNLHLLDPTGKEGTDATLLTAEVTALLSDSTRTTRQGISTKMVAARIAGERRLDASRGPLLALARSESEHTLVRMAAISALGRFAEPSDMKALVELAPEDARVADAIRHATRMAVTK